MCQHNLNAIRVTFSPYSRHLICRVQSISISLSTLPMYLLQIECQIFLKIPVMIAWDVSMSWCFFIFFFLALILFLFRKQKTRVAENCRHATGKSKATNSIANIEWERSTIRLSERLLIQSWLFIFIRDVPVGRLNVARTQRMLSLPGEKANKMTFSSANAQHQVGWGSCRSVSAR